MSKYRDQLKEGRKWALVEAGYREDLTAELKAIALEKADVLFDEFKKELEEIEQEEEDGYSRYDRKCERKSRRNMDDAA